VHGFWLLEQCLAGWNDADVSGLVDAASGVPRDAVLLFDVQDERFLSPQRMEDEIRAAAALPPDASRAVVVRSILESIAAAVGGVVDELRRTDPIEELAVVGGGAASAFVLRLLAERAEVRVIRGAAEATALGNAILQGIAVGRFGDLAEARRWADTSES
jgi:rhamnulokinase